MGTSTSDADRRLIQRAQRVVELTLAGQDAEALELLDVVLFDLRPETPGLDELSFALLGIQVTLAERLQREEQVMAAATAFIERLGPGTSEYQRLAVAYSRLRRGRVAYVMGRDEQARADVDAAVALLEAIPSAELSGARVTRTWLAAEGERSAGVVGLVVRRAWLRTLHRRIHWLIQQGDLDAVGALAPELAGELASETDPDCAAELRDGLVDIYGAYVAAERPDEGLAVLDRLVELLDADPEPAQRGRATVLLAIKALLLRSLGRTHEADALTDTWKARVGPETWVAQTAMLENSCALNDTVRAQQRAGSLLIRAMMLDELDRTGDAERELAGFADQFAAGQLPAVAPFVAVAASSRRALASGGRIADVMAGA